MEEAMSKEEKLISIWLTIRRIAADLFRHVSLGNETEGNRPLLAKKELNTVCRKTVSKELGLLSAMRGIVYNKVAYNLGHWDMPSY